MLLPVMPPTFRDESVLAQLVTTSLVTPSRKHSDRVTVLVGIHDADHPWIGILRKEIVRPKGEFLKRFEVSGSVVN